MAQNNVRGSTQSSSPSLKEIAGRLMKLSYTDMKFFGEELQKRLDSCGNTEERDFPEARDLIGALLSFAEEIAARHTELDD